MRVLSDPLAKYTSTMAKGIPWSITVCTLFTKSIVLGFNIAKLLN